MSRRAPRMLAAATAALLAASSLSLAVASPAIAANGSVSGTVFRDFNANGVFDTATVEGFATDTGFGGVTVTAYDAAGANVGTTTSIADGSYSIAVTGATGEDVRVEFTNLPAGYKPSAVHSSAADNGTAVQFAELGATDVDFAVNAPEDYSQGNAPLATAIQWAGSPLASEGGTKGDEPAVAAIGYDDGLTGAQTGFPGRVTLATYAEVGAVSSVVYQPSSNSMFVSAVVKRQSGLGELGIGGIYRITDVMDADGNPSGAGAVVPWLNAASLGIDFGTIPSNTDRGISGPQTETNDTAGFAESGKAGIGDMLLSPDGKTLFFVNLFDKKLYSVDVSDPTQPPILGNYTSYDLNLGDGEQPWALTAYRGGIYVGYVETGTAPGQSAEAAGLQFHVISAPIAEIGATPWTDVLTGDLGYTKGDIYQNRLAPQSHQWNTWTDTWTWNNTNGAGRVSQTGVNDPWQIYPQAVLSDLYFDEDGYLSLGFTDRTSLQGGNRNLAADPAVTGRFETGASGDLLIAAPSVNGTFALEENGTVGTRTTEGGNANEGPGGQEFYDDTQNLGGGNNHKEVTLGNLAGLRGTRQVVSTAYDPLTGIRLAGLMWFDVDNGSPVAGYELSADGNGPGGNNTGVGGNFQKGGGLGGISLLADAAPVEVGNRVWFDTNKDGIQDADEPPIAGLQVQLIKNGVPIGDPATTDANGEYYFSSDPSSDFFVEGFEPNGGEYSIQFIKPTTGNLSLPGSTVPWNTVGFTTPETSSSEIGSNPNPTTGIYTFTVGGPGENDHSIDAGFIVNLVPTVDIEKGDNGGSGTAIVNDADTMADGVTYTAGETRTIVFTVTNTGNEPLRDVTLTDDTLAGAGVQSLNWTFPGGATAPAVDQNGVLTAKWDATFAPGTTTWAPGAVITGTATLTLGATGVPHVDSAKVTAVGATSEIPVEDEDNYNAFVAGIQVIKYDGEKADPAVKQNGNWVTPTKPLVDAAQDANTVDESVVYPVNTPQDVRWVVTNTGPTSLTNITLTDVTNKGPAIGSDWTADLSPFGGPAEYSFVNNGPWEGILPPGASFFAKGTLTLPALEAHTDTVTVEGTVVVPEVDADGEPTGNPSLDGDGNPIVARDSAGDPLVLDDDDPFNARTGVGPFVDIEKGDGSGTTIVNDADTMADGVVYKDGETRDIVFVTENTGDEPLKNVVLTEDALSGAEVTSLEWTFPDGTTAVAQDINGVLTTVWNASFSPDGTAPPTTTWLPGAKITGRATLTITAGQAPHIDNAKVTAAGALSNIPVDDEDPYNAFTGAIQVIKYDGDRPDPVVTDGTNPIIPAKPLVGATQDANTEALAVNLKAGATNTVRWVVTNTGSTYLTQLTLVDVTNSGVPISGDWTADLSPIGGPSDYSFVKDGPWDGLFAPGESFFAEGKLTLKAGEKHADTVTVIGQVVVPEFDENGIPNRPRLDDSGNPVVAQRDGEPFTVTDNDPYNAKVPDDLAYTGWTGGTSILALALLLLAGGVILRTQWRPMMARRKS